MVRQESAYQFDFSGGALCLDFVNTIGDRAHGRQEHFVDWTSVVSWGEQAGLLSKRDAAALRRTGEARAPLVNQAFARAAALRECLYRLFAATGAGHAPASADLATFNTALGEAMRHARLDTRGRELFWSWSWSWNWNRTSAPRDAAFARIVWPVLRSAAELLVSHERAAVRECASERCSWLFVDRSRTRRRRWCSMSACGNRAKVRRFYERQKRSDRAHHAR